MSASGPRSSTALLGRILEHRGVVGSLLELLLGLAPRVAGGARLARGRYVDVAHLAAERGAKPLNLASDTGRVYDDELLAALAGAPDLTPEPVGNPRAPGLGVPLSANALQRLARGRLVRGQAAHERVPRRQAADRRSGARGRGQARSCRRPPGRKPPRPCAGGSPCGHHRRHVRCDSGRLQGKCAKCGLSCGRAPLGQGQLTLVRCLLGHRLILEYVHRDRDVALDELFEDQVANSRPGGCRLARADGRHVDGGVTSLGFAGENLEASAQRRQAQTRPRGSGRTRPGRPCSQSRDRARPRRCEPPRADDAPHLWPRRHSPPGRCQAGVRERSRSHARPTAARRRSRCGR